MKKAYLVLENGSVFEGQAVGAEGSALGEMVFTNGVVGYLETLTDPNYTGQIVMQTFPAIGNYGVIEEDLGGRCSVQGYVVREICDEPSNFRCNDTLNEYLKANGVVGICGVDTREITRILRDEGTMNALICQEIPDDKSIIRKHVPANPVVDAGVTEVIKLPAKGNVRFSVALIDYGFGRDIAAELSDRGCDVIIYPNYTNAKLICSAGHDGVVLSDGPGDPARNMNCAENIAMMAGRLPILGIGLGHQLAAIAMGGKTSRLKFGHHGSNYPVKDAASGRSWITEQNTCYTVSKPAVNSVVIYTNGSDGVNEGIEYPGKKMFTVQFRPHTCVGPNSTGFVYDRFIDMMGGDGYAKR